MANVPEGVDADASFPTWGVSAAGGMTEQGVLTISVKFVYSPEWKDGQPKGPEMETPWFAMPLSVYDDMIQGLMEVRQQMTGGNN